MINPINQTTHPLAQNRCSICIDKYATINLSSHLVKKMSLAPGDHIEFGTMQFDNKSSLYVRKSDPSTGYLLRRQNNARGLRLKSVGIARELLRRPALKHGSFPKTSFTVSPSPKEGGWYFIRNR